MKKFFSALFTGFALFFSIPTVLILASWNALPGESLYSVKSSLEDVALALTSNTPIATTFSVNFTDRRFTEAVRLLDKKGSTVGYELLVAEAQQTQNMIIKQQDVKNGAQLIRKIEEYQTEIKTKQAEVQGQVSVPSRADQSPSPTTPPSTSGENNTVIIIVPVEVVIEEEDPEEVIDNLEEVLEELEEIIEDIEEGLPSAAFEGTIDGQQNFGGEEEIDKPKNLDGEETIEEEVSSSDHNNKAKEKPPKD